MTADSPIDRDLIDSYRDLFAGRAEELIGELNGLFLDRAPGELAAACEAIVDRDPEAMRRAVHSLRNTASAIGAAQVARLCGEAEDAVGAPWEALDSIAERIAREVERVEAVLGRRE